MSLLTSQSVPAPTAVALAGARDTLAADLGAYFTAITPTPGTGIISHATNTTFVETKPLFNLYNGGAATIYPTYLRLTMTVISVGNTMMQFTTTIDQGARFVSGGTALTVNNSNINSSVVSGAQIVVGAVTVSAATPQRRVLNHRAFRPTVIGVAGDVYQYSWGSGILTDPASLPIEGTARVHVLYTQGPIVLPPGSSMQITAWGATYSTGATYEYELGFVEK